jgi:glyoxylase-like metal-dependent hydrolase (beta-lactamase superfamily II)/8-oxo-dGTP pyrophosphatase MutT (NUDIX family)
LSAAAIVLNRDGSGGLRVLVGRRDPRSRFLGGYFAFPGGAIEAVDGDPESEGIEICLRRAVSRELQEETGVVVAPDAFLPAGTRITPAFSSIRFETAMFVTSMGGPLRLTAAEGGELLDLEWGDPRVLCARWRDLGIRIAPPVVPMLQEMAEAGGESPESIARRLRRVNREIEPDGPRVEFVPDVLMVPVRSDTLPPASHTNCYLVGSREILIVDPGSSERAERERLLRHVRRRAEERTVPKAVVLTHHHRDHTGGAAHASRELGVPVLAHAETWARWKGAGEVPPGRRGELRDGERIELSGGERLHVLHTPGHAAGHVALFDETDGSLFAGDLVSGLSTVLIDSAPGSLEIYLSSLERIRDLDARTVLPAHGPPMIAPREAVQNLLDHRVEREERVLRALEGGRRDLAAIVESAYADTPDVHPELAKNQTEAHLDRLEGRGLVQRSGGSWERV